MRGYCQLVEHTIFLFKLLQVPPLRLTAYLGSALTTHPLFGCQEWLKTSLIYIV